MKHVKRVKSSVKGGLEHTLGPHTLIVGPNRSGKSAIVNAIELALKGDASDIVGRTVVREANTLLTLTDTPSLTSSVTLDDGQVVSGHMPGKKWLWTSQPAGIYDPETVFPLRALKDALAGAANTTRAFFLQYAASAQADDIQRALPELLRPLYASVAANNLTDAANDGTGGVLLALDAAKARLRDARATVKARETIVNDSGSGLAPPPSDEEMLKASAEVDALQARLGTLIGRQVALQQTAARAEHLQEQLIKLTKLQECHHVGLLDAQRLLGNLTPPAEIDDLRAAHLSVLQFAAKHALEVCPSCRQTAGTTVWADRVQTVATKMAARTAEIEEFRAHSARVEHLKTCAHQCVIDLARVSDEIELLPKVAPSLDDESTDIDELLSDARADFDSASAHVATARALQASWASIVRAKNGVVEAKQQAASWEALIDALETIIKDLLDAGIKTFEGRVQGFLPDDMHFSLRLRDGEREVCQFGLLQGGGQLHTALSGAEWATLLTALASTTITDSENLHIVTVEDRGWDPDMLASVLTALSDAAVQVILPTTTRPAYVPAGWTVIDLYPAVERTVEARTEEKTLKQLSVSVAPTNIEDDIQYPHVCIFDDNMCNCGAVWKSEDELPRLRYVPDAEWPLPSTPEAPAALAVPPTPVPAPKRGRGRPKKIKTPEAIAAALAPPTPPELE